ncbi:polyphosphate glucokinase [Auritidibacter sp. NML120779]|nr:polyphosphate glucokinase [Auritidibacter sp. NML120779]
MSGNNTPTYIGVDIGGTGMKGGIVAISASGQQAGELSGERFRIPTPQPATPQAVARTVAEIIDELDSREMAPARDRPVGICLPSVIHHGLALSANNIDPSWIETNAHELFSDHLHRDVRVINDADAAGLAEARFGAARGVSGSVLVVTLGTGIGSAMIHNGVLVPNFELGSLEFRGNMAERDASASARERAELSFQEYAEQRLQPYFSYLERLFSPELFVIGGGISQRAEEFLPYVKLRARTIPAQMVNNAGIIGAALFASIADASM